jgi:ribonuclease P protein component
MLPKRERLSRREFEYLRTVGRRTHGAHLTLLTHPTTQARGKCAVVVSKKTARKATARNLLRRRVYAQLANRPTAHSVVVFLKSSAAQVTPVELYRDLQETLERSCGSHRM